MTDESGGLIGAISGNAKHARFSGILMIFAGIALFSIGGVVRKGAKAIAGD